MAGNMLHLWYGFYFIVISLKSARGNVDRECVRYTDSQPWKPAMDQCHGWGGKVASNRDNHVTGFDLPQKTGEHIWTGDYLITVDPENVRFGANISYLCALVAVIKEEGSKQYSVEKSISKKKKFIDCSDSRQSFCVKESDDKHTIHALVVGRGWKNATIDCKQKYGHLWDGVVKPLIQFENDYNPHYDRNNYWINVVKEKRVVTGSSKINGDSVICGEYFNTTFSFITNCTSLQSRAICVLPKRHCGETTTTADGKSTDTATEGEDVGVVVGIVVLLGAVAAVVTVLVIRYRRRKVEHGRRTGTSTETGRNHEASASYEGAALLNQDRDGVTGTPARRHNAGTPAHQDNPLYDFEDVSEFRNANRNDRTGPNYKTENSCEYASVPPKGMRTHRTDITPDTNVTGAGHGNERRENDDDGDEMNNYIYSESSKVRDRRAESGKPFQSQDAANVYNTTNTSSSGPISDGDMYDRTNSGQIMPVCSNRDEYSSLGVPIEDNVYNRTFETTTDRKSENPDSVYNKLQLQEDEYNVAMPT